MAFTLKDFRFLVVDDLREMRMTLRGMLESLRATQITEARNSDEALEALKAQTFDVVLCDYNLNDTRDGQYVFEEARGRGFLAAHAAWLMITAEQTMGMVMGVVENNPDGYLVKPINKAVLQTRLERTIARKMVTKDIEIALRKDRATAALELANMQLQRVPQMRSELLRLKAEALMKTGAYDEVVDLCHHFVNERHEAGGSQENPWPHTLLGRAQIELGDLRQERQTFQNLIERAPTVMEAYDWLARIERESGDSRAAQRILTQALGVSPRSMRRHQALGDVAVENGDFATAERTFEKVLQMGEESCYARPDDQVGFISAVQATKGVEVALKGLADINKRASRRRVARGPHWQLNALEASLLVAAGRQAEAAQAAERALEGFRADFGNRNNAATLRLVKACFESGLQDDAMALVDKVVRENHDQPDVLDHVRAMFTALDMEDAGAALIEQAQAAVIKINNEGVLLAKAGRYKEAVALLRQAAEELPNSLTVLLNVLQALYLQMQAEGVSNQLRYFAREHLAHAERLAPRAEKVLQMKQRLQPFLRTDGA